MIPNRLAGTLLVLAIASGVSAVEAHAAESGSAVSVPGSAPYSAAPFDPAKLGTGLPSKFRDPFAAGSYYCPIHRKYHARNGARYGSGASDTGFKHPFLKSKPVD